MNDDTAFLQRWIDDGKNLCDLPPGSYWLRSELRVTETLVLGAGMTITGHGSKGTLIEAK